MNELEAPPPARKGAAMQPIDEFRRSILVSSVLAIAGSILFSVADSTRVGFSAACAALWSLFSAGEAWIQFRHALPRAGWIFAGLLTGLVISLLEVKGYHGWQLGLFVIPAAVEFLCAVPFRRQAWIWLIATPLIYCPIDLWVPWLGSEVRRYTPDLGFLLGRPFANLDQIATLACALGLILITRAAIRAFVTPPKRINTES